METGTIYYSPAWKEMLGYADDEIEPRLAAWERLLHPDDEARASAAIASVLSGGVEYEVEFRLLHKDGHYVSVLSRGLPLRRDAGGPVVRMVGTHFDLTECRAAAAALNSSEEKLALAKEAAGLGVFDYDLRSQAIHWDARAAEIWGIDPGEPMSRDVFVKCVHPEDIESKAEVIKRALDPVTDGRYYLEYRVVVRSDEQTRWVGCNGSVVFDQGRAIRTIGMVQDITERKRAEAHALREKDELLTLAESVGGTGSFEWLVPSDTVRLSPSLRTLYGVEDFDGRRETWLRLTHPDDVASRYAKIADVFAKRQTSYSQEYRIVTPKGQECWINIAKHAKVQTASAKVLRSGNNVVVVVRDSGVGLRNSGGSTSSSGLGLRGLREMIMSGGGEFSIHSPPEGGTVATLAAPWVPQVSAAVASQDAALATVLPTRAP